jgi:DNA repair exonuclease SbcCD ATPase subunit
VAEEAEQRLRVEREQRLQEVAALQRQFAEEKAALETEVGNAGAQATSVENARQALADQLAGLQRERDELAVRVDQMETDRAEREQRFQAELNRLNDAAEAVTRERTDGAANKELVQQVRELHAERTSLQAELQQARGRVAELESIAGELDALRAERDQLRDQVRQASERNPAQEVDGNVLAKALEGVSPRAGWPWFESARKEASAPASADKADAPGVQQQIAAVQQEFTRERTVLQTEVAKLRKENTLLRQYLENFGVQMIQM